MTALDWPLRDWPACDREMWARLIARGGPFDDPGGLSHLRETSRASLLPKYGRWIGWLGREQPLALQEAPVKRATPERLRAWIDADLPRAAPMSRLIFVDSVLRVLRAAAPEADWKRHDRLRAVLRSAARHDHGQRKVGRILSSAVLLEAGLTLACAKAEAATTVLQAHKRRRDGAMIALLAVMPMRVRSFVELELGTSLLRTPAGFVVALSGDMTKNGLPWEAEVPQLLTAVLARYLDEARPFVLARGGVFHGPFWVGDTGRAFTTSYFGMKMRTLTEREIGISVSPHFFRDAAATILARDAPESARLIRPLLAHASFGTAEKHYIHAQGIEAGRTYATVVNAMKNGSGSHGC